MAKGSSLETGGVKTLTVSQESASFAAAASKLPQTSTPPMESKMATGCSTLRRPLIGLS